MAALVDQLVRSGRPLPLAAEVAAVVTEFQWMPAICLGITLPFLLVPDGRLRSPRWRVPAAASVVAATIGPLAGSLVPGQLAETNIPNPFGLRGLAGTFATVIAFSCIALYWGSLLAALACVVLRFRSSRGVERQQLRWVAAGAIGAIGGLLVAAAAQFSGIAAVAGGLLVYLALLCVPVSIAVAVLRYRLYDLDRLINRTVVYGLLTAGGIAVYVAVVKLAEWLLREGVGLGGSLLATAVIAVGFAPARDRLQRWVDRRLYGERHDPVRAMARLGERLRDAPAVRPAGTCSPGCCRRCARRCGCRRPACASRMGRRWRPLASQAPPASRSPWSMKASRSGRWWSGSRTGEHSPRGGRPAGPGGAGRPGGGGVACGAVVPGAAALPGAAGGRSRGGTPAAAPRPPRRPRAHPDRGDPQGRRRSQRPRHAPDQADGLLAELRGDAKQAIGDLRRVIYDLRPASLDELGLLGALSQQVDRFGRQGLSVTLHAPPALPVLPAAVEVAAYRICHRGPDQRRPPRPCQPRHHHGRHRPRLCLEVHDDGDRQHGQR